MDNQTTPAPVAVPNRASPVKIIKWAIAAVVLLAIVAAAIYFWHQSQAYVTGPDTCAAISMRLAFT